MKLEDYLFLNTGNDDFYINHTKKALRMLKALKIGQTQFSLWRAFVLPIPRKYWATIISESGGAVTEKDILNGNNRARRYWRQVKLGKHALPPGSKIESLKSANNPERYPDYRFYKPGGIFWQLTGSEDGNTNI